MKIWSANKSALKKEYERKILGCWQAGNGRVDRAVASGVKGCKFESPCRKVFFNARKNHFYRLEICQFYPVDLSFLCHLGSSIRAHIVEEWVIIFMSFSQLFTIAKICHFDILAQQFVSGAGKYLVPAKHFISISYR